MKTYDPLCAPKPEKWLALSKAKRVALVVAYHARRQIEMPNPDLHAVVHTIVENQLAMNEPAEVRPALERLMHEGLDRHEAVHAIGMLVMEQMYVLLDEGQPNAKQYYLNELRTLTAASYREACNAAAAAAADDKFFPDADDDDAFFDALQDDWEEMDLEDEDHDDEFLR